MRHDRLSAGLLFALILVVIYASVVFAGKTLLGSGFAPNGITDAEQSSGRSARLIHNVDLATPAYYEQPINRLVGESYRAGDVPLWNPYQGAGTPLAAQGSTRALFPYQIVEDLAPPSSWDFFLLGRLWLAAFGTFLFLRALSLRFASAFAGEAMYMLSGSFAWFINLEQLTNVAMVIPFILWGLDGYLVRGRSRHFLTSVAAIALVLVAGQPETALYALFLASAYALLRIILEHRTFLARASGVMALVAMGLLGFALSFPPTLQFLQLSAVGVTTHQPGSPLGLETVPVSEWALGSVFPQVFTTPTWFRWPAIAGIWDFLGGYAGAVALTLILAGLWRGVDRHRPLFYFFFAFALAILLKNFGVPPFQWLGHLPLFDQVWSPRWAGPVWVFAMAIAAAFAFDAVIRAPHPPTTAPLPIAGGSGLEHGMDRPPALPLLTRRDRVQPRAPVDWRRTILPWVIPALGLAAVLIFTNAPELLTDQHPLTPRPVWPGVLDDLAISVWGGVAAGLVLFASAWFIATRDGVSSRRAAALLVLLLVEAWYLTPRGFDAGAAALKFLPLAGGIGLAWLVWRGRLVFALGAAVVVVGGMMALDISAQNGLPERDDPFRATPYVEFLRENLGDGRIVATDGVLIPNYASALELADVRYMNSIGLTTTTTFLPQLTGHPWLQTDSPSVVFSGRSEFVPELPPELGFSIADFSIRDQFAAALPQYGLLSVRYLLTPTWNRFIYTDGYGDWQPLHLPDLVSGRPSDSITSVFTDAVTTGTWGPVRRVLAPLNPLPQDLIYHYRFGEAVTSGFVHAWVDIMEPGAGVVLSFSTDGDTWRTPQEITRTGAQQIHRINLPPDFAGARDLWVKFTGWAPSGFGARLEQWGLSVETESGPAANNFFEIDGPEPQRLQPLAGLPLVYEGEVRIYENPAARPRTFLASTVLPSRDPEVSGLTRTRSGRTV